MAEYIDKEELIECLERYANFCDACTDVDCINCVIEFVIKELPTADVVEVVRCKDCIYYETSKKYGPYCNHPQNGLYDIYPDDYCSYGEQKE